jgi:hypothetical protein
LGPMCRESSYSAIEWSNMRHSRRLFVTLFALCALAATIAASAASAEEGFSPTTIYSGTGGEGFLETLAKEKVKCKAVSLLEGTMANPSEGGIGSIHFTGCTVLGFPANSLGDSKEVMLISNVFALVCLINPANLEFGVLIKLKETVHLEVPLASVLIGLSGTLIGKISPNAKGKVKTLTFEQLNGDAKPSSCTNTKSEKKTGEGKYEQNENGKPENFGLELMVALTLAAETALAD